MQLTEIRELSRDYKHTVVANDPDDKLDKQINRANNKIKELIMEAEGHQNVGGSFKITNFVSSEGLVAGNNGYNGEYTKPKGAVIDEVHVDYGTGAVKSEIIDKSELSSSMFEEDIHATKDKPKVFLFRDSYFVRPLNDGPTVIGGLKLLVQSVEDELVEETDEPSWYPSFHELIPLYVALEYYRKFPDKYNAKVANDAQVIEEQLISKIENENPTYQRLQTVKEQF